MENPFGEFDEHCMRRAIDAARRAWGRTRPNPHVGAVIARDGRIVAEGFHERAGQPHAERNALAACSENPRGATMYVTLEPCNHHGRTPPCVDAILDAGIARVVLAQRDPNAVARGGVERLRAEGVQVDVGLLEDEAWMLNPAFNTFHERSRPLVTLKWAMSADGCTSAAGGQSAWISNPASRRRVHMMRAAHDAVLVGIGTALQDNARLSARDVELLPGPSLRRVVLDTNLRIPIDHALLRETQGIATIFCADDAPRDREEILRAVGGDVIRVPRTADGGALVVPSVLAALHGLGVQSVLVEGGRRVAGSFAAAGLVDRVAIFVAPAIVGSGRDAQSALVADNPIRHMQDAARLHHVQTESIDGDVLMTGWLTENPGYARR